MTFVQFLDQHFFGIAVTLVILAAILAEGFARGRR